MSFVTLDEGLILSEVILIVKKCVSISWFHTVIVTRSC